MNQYEIELRDKYFEKAWDELMIDYRIQQQRKKNGEPAILMTHEGRLNLANLQADRFMAERQKHLDALKPTNEQVIKAIEEREERFDMLMDGVAADLQGTECDR